MGRLPGDGPFPGGTARHHPPGGAGRPGRPHPRHPRCRRGDPGCRSVRWRHPGHDVGRFPRGRASPPRGVSFPPGPTHRRVYRR
ncbi:hypothetical protein ACFFX0_09505 [Citricoccus parietis]|uniref:Uncharacterized protein n=1 Tax=Citricoccus parietis TaxID=592307 RepID=A0ABV5FXL7_9MICC